MREIIHPGAVALFGECGAMALYEALAGWILAEFPNAELRPRRTQIGFAEGRLFACASRAAVRRKAERPDPWITVSLGLPRPLESPRALAVRVRFDIEYSDENTGIVLRWLFLKFRLYPMEKKPKKQKTI